VFPVRIPPLRERRDDIPKLVRHFVQQFARRMNKTIDTIPAEAMGALIRYDWPGNIRELQNLMERAVIVTRGTVLSIPLKDLVETARLLSEDKGSLEDAEKKHILSVLRQCDWVVDGANGAAARLGMKRSTLYFRMRKLGISRRGSKEGLPGHSAAG